MPNKVYLNDETPVVWGSEVGDDEALTSESVANGAGRRGAIHDWGAAPRADRFRIEMWAQFVATPTLGEAVRVYVYEWGPEGSATPDHGATDGTTDAAISNEDDLVNAAHVTTLTIREAVANTEFYATAEVEVTSRHWGPAFFNDSGASTTADAAETKIRATPIPPEVQ